MPTQEERLAALEQNMAAVQRAVWDVNHNETMLLGIAMEQGRDIRDVKRGLTALTERISIFEENVNNRFEAQDKKFEAFDKKLEIFDQRLEAFNQRFEIQDKKIDQILLLLNTL
ncbi:MAG: hypothetical protein ACRDHZ_11600, partial [Ktedonobacteraceae bacterium]